jgi:CAAX protease family protein
MTENVSQKAAGTGGQYSLAKIVGIWAAATLPITVLGWIVFPLVAPDYESDPLGSGVTRVILLTLGLVWQFGLSMFVVRQEEGDLCWATVRRGLRLGVPQDPKTGERRNRLWLWVVPALIGIALLDQVLVAAIDQLWVSVFPIFCRAAGLQL